MTSASRFFAVTFGMLVVSISGTAFGQLITPLTGTASTELGGPFDRVAAHAVDGSGLGPGDNFAFTPDQTHNSLANGVVWLSTGAGIGGVDPNPTYTVTFADIYSVIGFRVFNYNEVGFTSRGVQVVNIEVSLDGFTFTPLLNNITFSQAPGNDTYTGEYFDLVALTGSAVQAVSIRFNIQSDYGDPQTFYGLSELQFDGSLIPEPTSSALMAVGGLALIVMLHRRGKPGARGAR